ncbi:MAG: D-alanyl-D-alanine carboxypeptidase family protein [Clostridiaceae bacterium]
MKKRLVIFFLVLAFFTSFIRIFSYADGIEVEAKSALLMEPVTGEIIYEKNIHQKFAPASVTKIMTMLITMEYIDSGRIHLNDKVTISENAKKMGGSTMLLDTGEIRTVEELIKGVAIASGNDAAVALSEYIAGSEDAFVDIMNIRAKDLDMKDTSFKNSTGLPESGHLTSAYDIALMSRELLKHQTILKYTGTYMETITEGRKTPIGLVNHNKLVRFFKGCDGLKTGYTEEAKYCISATAVRDSVRMLTVIMGAPSYKVRNRDASSLMNYGFSKYEYKTIITKDQDIEKIYLNKKKDKYFTGKACSDFKVLLLKGTNNQITTKCVIDQDKKIFKKGDKIGYCEVYANGKIIGRIDIWTDQQVRRGGLLKNLNDGLQKLFFLGV